MLKISVVLMLVVVVCATADLLRAVDVDVDDEEIKDAADKAVYHINEELPGHFHHKLVKISEARKLTYVKKIHLTLIVGMTTCKKQEVTYEEAKQCDIQEGESAYKKCQVSSEMKDKSKLFFYCRKISESEI